MIRLLSTHRLVCSLLLLSCTILCACSSTGKIRNDKKVGLHIDTVLDFVVDYPLSWDKERLLIYGSKDGEVIWAHAEHPAVVLRIESRQIKVLGIDAAQRIDRIQSRYVGLKVSTEEQTTIPAGKCWHVTGQTSTEDVEFYLFLHPKRSYLIVLTTPLGTIDNYQETLAEVLSSFQVMLE